MSARVAWAALGALLAIQLAGGSFAHAASASHRASASAPTPRAPSGPPLAAGGLPEGDAEAAQNASSSQDDPLVENGLSSPFCRGPTSGELSAVADSNCHASRFTAAPAPTGNYGIDVNIEQGLFGVGYGTLLSVVQDLFVQPMWNSLVWMVHALLVMVEWCYALSPLDSSAMDGVLHGLHATQAVFTQPWLALVLSLASMLALYNGLVRRRVAETVGQVLLTIAMMGVGFWVILDPIGTVGTIGKWSEQTSIGTLGAVTQGTPTNAPRVLADSMRALFESSIQAPWCYLEFGSVRWCEDPAQLDPRLRSAAVKLAPERGNRLLRNATTNGDIFLAFPANGVERNSFKEPSSLLHIMCSSDKAKSCTGATAPQAAFRSNEGTFPRMIGVVGIAVGVLGMVLLFGFVAVRLLGASALSLFLLLLAPAAVLAPALGDGGRAAFASWMTRLLGAVTSKLLYSFLLGVLLVVQRTLTMPQLFGWWTQWLLFSVFWWGMFVKRHQALTFIYTRGRDPFAGARQIRPKMALDTPRTALNLARLVRERADKPASDSDRLTPRESSDRKRSHMQAERPRVPFAHASAVEVDGGTVGGRPSHSGPTDSPSGEVSPTRATERPDPPPAVRRYPSPQIIQHAREVAEGRKGHPRGKRKQ